MYQEVKVSDVQNVQFSEFTGDKLEAQIFFTIENPNWYDIKMKDSKIDVFLEGSFLGTIEQFDEILIPKKSTTVQIMKMTSTADALSKVLGNALALFFKEELKLEAKGYVQGKALFINKRIDVNVSEGLKKEDLGL
jgi:LEA14-like dessication related protein